MVVTSAQNMAKVRKRNMLQALADSNSINIVDILHYYSLDPPPD